MLEYLYGRWSKRYSRPGHMMKTGNKNDNGIIWSVSVKLEKSNDYGEFKTADNDVATLMKMCK